MKLPTSSQWLKAAKATEGGFTGLCAYWDMLDFERGEDLYHAFLSPFAPRRVYDCKNKRQDGYGFWWTRIRKGRNQRAFFCCMMSAITAAGDMESMIEEA